MAFEDIPFEEFGPIELPINDFALWEQELDSVPHMPELVINLWRIPLNEAIMSSNEEMLQMNPDINDVSDWIEEEEEPYMKKKQLEEQPKRQESSQQIREPVGGIDFGSPELARAALDLVFASTVIPADELAGYK